MKKPFIKILSISLGLIIAGTILVGIHQVDNELTKEDVAALKAIMKQYSISPLRKGAPPHEEIQFIQEIQKAVLALAPTQVGIGLGHRREPKDVIEARHGLCYDRSRLIEKMLTFNGFKVRHVGLYSTQKTGSPLKTLITRKPGSHSITEVKISDGWMVVDSNQPWISIDRHGKPISLAEIQKDTQNSRIQWNPDLVPFMNKIYKVPFIYVYGLYSRHGRFYPPYNVIPDINWGEFLDNF